MSLPVNDKKGKNNKTGTSKGAATNSKFIKTSTKSASAPKKVRSTGANRGS